MPCNSLLYFPNEILLDIASYLGARELGMLTRSCRRLHNLLNELLYRHSSLDDSISAATPLAWAAKRGARGTLHRIFEYTTPSPQDLAAALLSASMNNHVAFARVLIARGAPTQGTLTAGNGTLPSTPLYAAAIRGHLHMVQALLDGGARPAYCGIETMVILLGRCTRVPAARKHRPHQCDRRIVQLIFHRGLCVARYEGLLLRVLREDYNLCCVACYLLELGFDPNAQDDKGRTAIMLAIGKHARRQGDGAIARFVSRCEEFGARVDARDLRRGTALHAAAAAGLPITLRALLAAGADPNASRGRTGSTPLGSTISSFKDTPQAWETLRALLDGGADMGDVNERGWRRIIPRALRSANRTWLQEFLARGLAQALCSPRAAPVDQLLLVAAFLGDSLAVRQMLGSLGPEDGSESDDGQDIPVALRRTDNEGNTTLMIAARLGYDDVIRALIPHMSRARVRRARNTSGESVLHLAMYSGKASTVRLLAEWLPDGLCGVDGMWRTPLAVAVEVQTTEVVEYLLDRGCNIATRDIEQRTLLHYAVDRGSEQIVRLLLARQCPRTRDRSGETALMRAARKAEAEIVRLFLEYCEYPEHREQTDQTMLIKAVLAGSPQVAKVVADGVDLEAGSEEGPTKAATTLIDDISD
ncbi:ankyrin repeat-containing domain protein [Aspergillus carlsbadensis]|nr:ankyrin repeat-containing domain protein [Aspergillus carlsbadensis]